MKNYLLFLCLSLFFSQQTLAIDPKIDIDFTKSNQGNLMIAANPYIQEVPITSQINEFYFGGTASENGGGLENSLVMNKITNSNGSYTGIYEIYTHITSGKTFCFYSNNKDSNAPVYGAGNTPGSVQQGANPIIASFTGVAHIKLNINDLTYEITPIDEMSVMGTVISSGWDKKKGLQLNYDGRGVWSNTVDFGNAGDWCFVMNQSEEVKKTSLGNKIIFLSEAVKNGIATRNMSIKRGRFIVKLDLQNYKYSIATTSVDEFKISVMGSSVADGTGATNNKGYAFMYDQLLRSRYAAGLGYNWKTSGISIGGNNTLDLLNRWDRDLISDGSKYVIYGLSLGNEGIHEYGKSRFDRYRDNMLLLIDMAKEAGKYPIVMNSYTRGDFTGVDYDYVKQMDLLIHEWDVPSFSTLGAIDNGAGRWADGYQNGGDGSHPNDAGHAEFFYAMVPSLFDALNEGKKQPQRVLGTTLHFKSEDGQSRITWTPEPTLHPFTLSFGFKTISTGTIASFKTASGMGYLKIKEDGTLYYESPIKGEIKSEIAVNDGLWKQVTLTHYYAQGRTLLYVDNKKIGELKEKMVANLFYLNDYDAAVAAIDFRELFFYRAAMNLDEIKALFSGRMLKSSLEIYAPLNGLKENADKILENLAQSTNTLKLEKTGGSGISMLPTKKISIYPNPSSDLIYINGLDDMKQYMCSVFTVDGRFVLSQQISQNNNIIDVSSLLPAFFSLEIRSNDSQEKRILNFIKK